MKEKGYGETIRERRRSLGINQTELASRIGVSRNAVAGWETGHSRPDLDTIRPLCAVLGMTLESFFGAGDSRTVQENRALFLFRSLDDRDREALIWQMEGLSEGRRRRKADEHPACVLMETGTPRPVHDYVTLYRSDLGVAAGTGTVLEEERGEEIILLADRNTEAADEVITVSGDSMEPTFYHGDLVLVQHTEKLRPGEIGIFLVEDEGYIKEYREDGLHSHNPAYETMRFTDGETVRCIGKVLGKVTGEEIPDREQINAIQEAREGGKRGE